MVKNNDLKTSYIPRISEMLPGAAQEMNHPIYSQAHKTRRVHINFLGSVVAGPTR